MLRLALILILVINPFIAFANNDKPQELNRDLTQRSNKQSEADKVKDELLKEEAYKQIIKELDILTPEQRREIQNRIKANELATKRMYAPTALNDIIAVKTAPGSKIERVFLSENLDTLLSVIDATGQPWPITFVSSGNGTEFPVEHIDVGRKNNIKINALHERGSTNLTLLLKDSDTVITLELVASHRRYHPQPIIQIDALGPNAKQATNFTLGAVSYEDEMKNVVLGLPPTDSAKLLESSDSNVKAWLGADGSLYIQTKYTPQYPRNPRGIRAGNNGFIAYKMKYLPVITMSDMTGNEKHIHLREL